ncbi:MAG: hypothetical protein IJ193_07440, partial [Bacilli bacterium]|nr:hypothetical protein [Bacilli bacterium]
MAKRRIILQRYHKRKVAIQIIFLLFVFMGIGYSVLGTNLSILGNILVKKPVCQTDNKLYNVLKCETENGGLARKYTGEHKDSFTEAASKDIYHWYADNNTNGTAILDKNNVLFAGQCWQMIRTTDT